MKQVIVIGGSGFLGSAVVHELLAGGYRVFATVHNRSLSPMPGLTALEGGITGLTTATLDRIRPEAVFHCARPVMPRFRRPGRIFAAWQAKCYNRFLLSQIAASTCMPSLVFASGSLVYGNSPSPHAEDAVLNPVSYAREYHHGERPILQAVAEHTSNVVMVRFPWLLGEGSWFSWFYLKPLREKKMVPLFGDGENLMSLVSLKDAARVMVRVHESGTGSGIVNVVSPFVLSQRSFAGRVAGHYHGSVTDYRELFPRGVEKAVEEAFRSNILLKSNHPELFKGFVFQSPEQVMDGMGL